MFRYENLREMYTLHYPQPSHHINGEPTIPMPGGVCSNRELDKFLTLTSDIRSLIEMMRDAVGKAGIVPGTH